MSWKTRNPQSEKGLQLCSKTWWRESGRCNSGKEVLSGRRRGTLPLLCGPTTRGWGYEGWWPGYHEQGDTGREELPHPFLSHSQPTSSSSLLTTWYSNLFPSETTSWISSWMKSYQTFASPWIPSGFVTKSHILSSWGSPVTLTSSLLPNVPSILQHSELNPSFY